MCTIHIQTVSKNKSLLGPLRKCEDKHVIIAHPCFHSRDYRDHTTSYHYSIIPSNTLSITKTKSVKEVNIEIKKDKNVKLT